MRVVAVLVVIISLSACTDAGGSSALAPAPTESKTSDPETVRLKWPPPFVPAVTATPDREKVTVIYPNKVVAHLSYPRDLGLAAKGMQPSISYSLPTGSMNEVLFVNGPLPRGLFTGPPLTSFDGAQLYRVAHEDLRAEFALVWRHDPWHIIATLPSRSVAEVVAENLFTSVAKNGFPSLMADDPVTLSQGFGEAWGAHIDIGDANPVFNIVDANKDFDYITSGVVKTCLGVEERVTGQAGGHFYASRCLEFSPGSFGLFFSIYGRERFVRRVFEGLRLEV